MRAIRSRPLQQLLERGHICHSPPKSPIKPIIGLDWAFSSRCTTSYGSSKVLTKNILGIPSTRIMRRRTYYFWKVRNSNSIIFYFFFNNPILNSSPLSVRYTFVHCVQKKLDFLWVEPSSPRRMEPICEFFGRGAAHRHLFAHKSSGCCDCTTPVATLL